MHARLTGTTSEPELSSPLGTASDWLVKNYYKKLFSSWNGQKKKIGLTYVTKDRIIIVMSSIVTFMGSQSRLSR